MIYDLKYYSPNFGYPKGSKGRRGQQIIGVGTHISGAEWQSNYNWIMNPAANASYNAIILRDGRIVQLVPEEDAAYSHGKITKPSWPLLKSGVNPNLYTLSVARVGSNQNTWDAAQMNSMVRLIMYWAGKYSFKPEWPAVFGHKHIDSVDRWYCPGDPFLTELYKRLKLAAPSPTPIQPWPNYPIPKIERTVGVEHDGVRTPELGFLARDPVTGLMQTYLRSGFIAPLPPSDVSGHGDHIKLKTLK